MSDMVEVVCPGCDTVNRVPRARVGEGKCGRCSAALFEKRPIALDGARLMRHVQRSGLPLLVDFWAAWCGPCRAMAPVFESAAERLAPEVRLLKVDTEQAGDVATRLGIRSIPTLILFEAGREKARISGALDLSSLERWVAENR